MAGQAFIINPKRRRGKGGRFVKSSRRSPARKTRTTSRKRRSYRKNPLRAARTIRRTTRRSNARKLPTGRRRYRRNPSLRSMSRGIIGTLQGAAMGAAGSLLTDAAFTYIPMPAIAKTGNVGLVTRAASAFGVGWLASFVIGKSRAAKLTEGALTVQIANFAKAQISQRFLPLAGDEELGYYSAGMIGEYLSGDMGSFPRPAGSPGDRRMGEYLSEYAVGDEYGMLAADEYSF